jgi:DNA (cytosine-5)-methyltransferase 1
MNELHLFAGAGGGILGGQLLGHTTVCAVEIEEYPRQVLLQRQRDGVLPKFPIWDDVCTFDGKPWRGTVDVVCGGFPCQDISSAGRGAGIGGKRSGLWKEYARIIREIRPKFVFAENSPLLRTRGLDVVLGDLSELGYDAKWCVLGAWHVGAPHKRNRMWVLAYPNPQRLQGDKLARGPDAQGRQKQNGPVAKCGGVWWHKDPSEVGDASMLYAQGCTDGSWQGKFGGASKREGGCQENWPIEPAVGRVAHGVAHRVDRLKAIGNGQVPAVAATAWNILNEGLD